MLGISGGRHRFEEHHPQTAEEPDELLTWFNRYPSPARPSGLNLLESCGGDAPYFVSSEHDIYQYRKLLVFQDCPVVCQPRLY